MARWLKQSTSVDVPIGPFVDATDGVTAETALTITQPDVRLKKNAGAWAQKAAAQTLTHEENGYYEVTLDATDTNTLGLLRLAVSESGALPIWEDFLVVTANVYDSLFSTDVLDVSVTQVNGAAQTATLDTLKTDTAAILVDTGTTLDARIPAALVGGRMDASVGANAAGVITAAAIATGAIDADALAADVITDIWQGTALTEGYATDGAAATPAQLLYMILAALTEFSISGTTITVKKLDGSTTAATFTLNDATNPTSRTRAS